MRRSNRGQYLAIGGCLAFLLLAIPALGQDTQPNPITEGAQGSTSDQTEPTPNPPSLNAESQAADSEEPAVDQFSCAQSNDCAEKNFAAQTRMADATDEMVRLAREQLSATYWEIVFLLATVIAALLAVGAAVWANLIARDSAENELRAYIVLALAQLDPGERNRCCSIKIKLVNYGQTPAYDITYLTRAALVPVGGANEFDLGFSERPKAGGVLGPQQVLDTPTIVVGENGKPLFGNIDYERFWVFCWGRVDFKDIFGKPRWIEFHLFQKDRVAEGLSPSPEHNKTSESARFS